jgi:hypothetical protein
MICGTMKTDETERKWGPHSSRLSMTWVHGPDGLEFHWTLQPPPAAAAPNRLVHLEPTTQDPPQAA